MRIWLVACCAAVPVLAQISSMATDFAGNRLFFTTELSQADSGQPPYGKLFLADELGVRPLLIRSREVLHNNPSGLLLRSYTNVYNLDGTDVASNGTLLSVVGLRECSGTSIACHVAEYTTIYNDRGQVAMNAEGRVLLSPNGKWGLGVAGGLSSPGTDFRLYDLTTGASYGLLNTLTTTNRDWRLHDVADDGTASGLRDTRSG